MYVRASVNYELAAGLRTAQEAVRYVDENKVDLLILDVMMQDGIDGLTAAEMIKQKHPEVKSIFEWSGEGAVIIETEEEAESLSPCGKMGVVAQTTFSGEKFEQIAARLISKSNDIHIIRTICTATDQRQKAAIDLAGRVDMMLVIGGKNSANTTRLAELCAEQTTTHHLETASELQDAWFENKKIIGITAGASTPDWIIKEVYQKCQKK